MKVIYHTTEAPRAIPDEDDIPEGWADTPAAFGVITCPSLEQIAEMQKPHAEIEKPHAESPEPAPADDRGALLAEAEQHGITVDRRWGVEKLRAALNGNADST